MPLSSPQVIHQNRPRSRNTPISSKFLRRALICLLDSTIAPCQQSPLRNVASPLTCCLPKWIFALSMTLVSSTEKTTRRQLQNTSIGSKTSRTNSLTRSKRRCSIPFQNSTMMTRKTQIKFKSQTRMTGRQLRTAKITSFKRVITSSLGTIS